MCNIHLLFLIFASSAVANQLQHFDPLLQYLKTDKEGSCEENLLDSASFNFRYCIESIEKRVSSYEAEDPTFFIRDLCTSYNFNSCWVNMASMLKPCLGDKMYNDFFNYYITAINDAQEFLCSDEGQPLIEYITYERHCLSEPAVMDKVRECHRFVAQGEDDFADTFGFAILDCRVLVGYGACVVKAADECENKRATNFLENLLVSLLQSTDCKESLDAELRGSSTSMVESVVFVSVIFSFSVHSSLKTLCM